MTERTVANSRSLPVLDLAAPAPVSAPRSARQPRDSRLHEYLPEVSPEEVKAEGSRVALESLLADLHRRQRNDD